MNTYATYMNETDSTRMDSHDFSYSSGPYTYHDTYVGGEKFAGEEAIWVNSKIQYAMNYLGRVLDQQFNGAAASRRPEAAPAALRDGKQRNSAASPRGTSRRGSKTRRTESPHGSLCKKRSGLA